MKKAKRPCKGVLSFKLIFYSLFYNEDHMTSKKEEIILPVSTSRMTL